MNIDVIVKEFPWWHDLNSMWSESPKLNAPFNTNSATHTEDLEGQFAGVLAPIEPSNHSTSGTLGMGTIPVECIDSDSDDNVAAPANLLKQPWPVKVETGDDFKASNLNHVNNA